MNERERVLEIIRSEWDRHEDAEGVVLDVCDVIDCIVSRIEAEPEPLVCKTIQLSPIGTKELRFPVLIDGLVERGEVMALHAEMGHVFILTGVSGTFKGPNQDLTITLTPGNGLAAVMQMGPPAKPPGRLLRLWRWLTIKRGE